MDVNLNKALDSVRQASADLHAAMLKASTAELGSRLNWLLNELGHIESRLEDLAGQGRLFNADRGSE